MTHVVVGYPTVRKTIELVKVMAEAGADGAVVRLDAESEAAALEQLEQMAQQVL